VKALLARMTLAEKIGQMTQAGNRSITPAEVTSKLIGPVLSGGGGNPEPNTPKSWAAMVRGYQEAALKTRLGIPLLYGADAVHGHNSVRGAEIFPCNVGLRDDGALTLVVVNLGPEERIYPLRVEGFAAGAARVGLFDAGHAAEQIGTQAREGEVTLPPQSMTLYVLEL
jgi:hypothetical protein